MKVWVVIKEMVSLHTFVDTEVVGVYGTEERARARPPAKPPHDEHWVIEEFEVEW